MIAEVDIQEGLDQAWTNVATFVPKFLGFFLILLIGWFVAKALSKLTNSLLERVGFDTWVERGTLKTAFDRAKTDASDVIGVIVFWAVFLFVLQLAFGVWGPNPISDMIQGVISYLPNLIVAIVILVIASALAKVVTDVLTPVLGSVGGGEMIARAAGIAILVFGVFAALNQLADRTGDRQRPLLRAADRDHRLARRVIRRRGDPDRATLSRALDRTGRTEDRRDQGERRSRRGTCGHPGDAACRGATHGAAQALSASGTRRVYSVRIIS